MESNFVPTPPTTPANTSQAQIAIKKPSNLPIILGALIFSLITGAGGYFLGIQNSKGSLSEATNLQTNASPTYSPEPTNIQKPSISPGAIPSDWTIKKSSTCNVNLPLPPKKEPYYIPDDPITTPSVNDEGGYWRIQENPEASSDLFKKSVVAVFGNPDTPGGGYVAGIVQVRCSENPSNYTTKTLLAKYTDNFTNGTYTGLSLDQKGQVSLWGQSVEKLSVVGGMYPEGYEEYLFVTNSNIYLISKGGMSSNTTIKTATDLIFNNLKFSN